MARAGVASRRKSEEMIVAGRVTVNNELITELGFQVKKGDEVKVDGVPITKESPVYYLFYKPKNVLSAVRDDRDRPVVTDFFQFETRRIYPVGRLDFDTTGVLLLTNDGDLTQELTHPKHEIDKTYIATLSALPSEEGLKQLERGVVIDGKKTRPATVEVISINKVKQKAVVSLTIHEGWNHQVKKMFEAIGCPVNALKREKLAFLTLKGLTHPGDYRQLSAYEVQQLKRFYFQSLCAII